MTDTRPEVPMQAATRIFLGCRELLFSIVYNMLGSVADTEDVLQETWLAWQARYETSGEDIANPRAYLVRIAVNTALARQSAIRRRRETYVGTWLPEPVLTEADDGPDAAAPALRAKSVSMALLVVLEALTPLERAVFVLHEVFGYPHTEIADILDRSAAAIRQLAHRAREHVHARRPKYRADPQMRRTVTERFLAAALGGDLEALLRMLAPDVTMWTDGGGRTSATTVRPVQGRDKVARLVAAVAPQDGIDVRYRTVNGDPAAVLFTDDVPFAVMVLDLSPDGEQVSAIYTVTNPDKLSGIADNKTEQ
jgi:RNA polymerase sigma factor (sigma-70 family)